MDDDLISVSEGAKRIGINKSTLSRQIAAGLIRSHNGLVRLSEVLEDRANNIDHAMARRKKAASTSPLHQPAATEIDATVGAGASFDEGSVDSDVIIFDGKVMPLGKAKALKETYLALRQKLEFEVESERLVDREAYENKYFELARQDRDSWVNWPARVSPLMASELGVNQVALAVVLEKYVRQHLVEQSDPSLR